jgi:hypothetical protein
MIKEQLNENQPLRETAVISRTNDLVGKSEGWVITFNDNGIETVNIRYFSTTKRGCIKRFLEDWKGDTWTYLKRILNCKCVRGSIKVVAYGL